MNLELNEKRALITGSYRGTGAGLARVMAREGATVWVHGFEIEPAEAVAQSIREEGFQAQAVAGDIRTDEGAREVATTVGEIDILVNNYGVAEGGSWESPTEDWIDIYQKNVLSGVRLVHALTPGMRERGWGRVIFLSTVGYVRPNSKMPHYYASKTALINMTVSLAKELANTGITVNCVLPASAAHRMDPDGNSERAAAFAAMYEDHPIGRDGDPLTDIAPAVAFLLSDASRYVTGQTIAVDGGGIMRA